MNYLFVLLLMSLSSLANDHQAELEESAKKKSQRYASFLEAMSILEMEESELAIRREFQVFPIQTEPEDHSDLEYIVLTRADFEE